MSFADAISQITETHFAQLGDEATYTAPADGAVAVVTRVMVDEPNVDVLPGHPRHAMRDRKPELWIARVDDEDGQWFGIDVPERGATITATTPLRGTRTFRVDSVIHADPDRTRVAALEITAP